MKKLMFLSVICFLSIIMLGGCQSTNNNSSKNNLTVGLVQQNIKKGITKDQVVETLGSPNIITSDGNGGETWVYDKISTETNASRSMSGLGLILLNWGKNGSSVSSTQKTLTVIIKFNQNNVVVDFNYRTSTF